MPGILIDVMQTFFRRDAGEIPRGIDRVSLEYIRRYADEARAVLSLGPLAGALSRSDSARVFEWLLRPIESFHRTGARLVLKNTLSGWIRPRTGNSILLNTQYLWFNTRFYAAQLRLLGARPVFFVHDLIPLSHPAICPPDAARQVREHIRNVLRMSRGIIVNSRDTERALRCHADRMALPVPPIVVAPLAPAFGRQPVPEPPSGADPYFVVLGTIEPRKNQVFLLKLWRDLIAREAGQEVPRLYVVGQRGYRASEFVELLMPCASLQGTVVERNDCGDEEAARLIQHARALLMPTVAEGFGLPIAEALAAGVPVIASDLPVFREFAGEIPEYADPADARRWMELVIDYAQPNSARREAQLARLKGFRRATWEDHFSIVDRFLESLP